MAGEEMGEGLEVEIIKGFEESFWRDLCRNGWFLQVHFIVSSTVLFLPLNLGSLRQLETSLVAQSVVCLQYGRPGLIPGSGRSPGEGNSNPLQYSCLENPMDGGAWQAIIHGRILPALLSLEGLHNS